MQHKAEEGEAVKLTRLPLTFFNHSVVIYKYRTSPGVTVPNYTQRLSESLNSSSLEGQPGQLVFITLYMIMVQTGAPAEKPRLILCRLAMIAALLSFVNPIQAFFSGGDALGAQKPRSTADQVDVVAAEAQSAVIARLQQARRQVDEDALLNWVKKTWPLCTRQRLIDDGYLAATAPDPGSRAVIADRTPLGTDLLNGAKDMLWAALYGTQESNVVIQRVERELLVITVPGRKVFVFNFFQAVTEVGALGTWRDPEKTHVHDQDEPNMMLQVEYGESASEVVGDVIMVSIHLINLLEVNEVVLYARSSNIEQSTLSIQLHDRGYNIRE